MSDIFRRSKHKQEYDAGEAAPVVGYDKPTGSVAADLKAARGGPTSEIANRETPAEKEARERREAEAARMKAEREAFARKRAGGS